MSLRPNEVQGIVVVRDAEVQLMRLTDLHDLGYILAADLSVICKIRLREQVIEQVMEH